MARVESAMTPIPKTLLLVAGLCVAMASHAAETVTIATVNTPPSAR